MYAFTRTPLGRMCNAVRDNPERVEFIGYNTQRVRYIAFCIAGFFAGIAGGARGDQFRDRQLAEVVGAGASGSVLLVHLPRRRGFFFGPIIGAVLVTCLQSCCSDVTKAWQLYLGLVFIVMVMYAPGGIASLIMMHGPLWRARAAARAGGSLAYAARAAAGAAAARRRASLSSR